MIEIDVRNLASHKVSEVAAALVKSDGEDAVLIRNESEDGYIVLYENGVVGYFAIGAMYQTRSFEYICDSWDFVLVKIFEEENDFTLRFTAD